MYVYSSRNLSHYSHLQTLYCLELSNGVKKNSMIKKNYLFTVIIPTYNVEKYIVSTISSVFKQTYTDFCIIIVDDASTDNTVEIIKRKYEEEIISGKITLIEQKQNSGPATTRQMGLDNVTTPYVMFLDADDHYLSNQAFCAIEKKIRCTEADMIMWKYITDHGNIKLKKRCKLPTKEMCSKDAFIERVKSGNPIWHYLWNKVYKTSIIKENDISFINGLRGAEDVRFNEDLFPFLKKIAFIDEYLYVYNCTNTASLTSGGAKTSISEDDIRRIWNRECENYTRLVNTICKPLDCSETCEPILRSALCMVFIRCMDQAKEKPWGNKLKEELLISEYGILIQPIYKKTKHKYQINKLNKKLRTIVKKFIKH